MTTCAICGSPSRTRRHSARLSIATCVECGHASANHGASTVGGDYHASYDDDFLDALAVTRRRQSEHWVGLIRTYLPHAQSLVDFGAGRGFLLEAARRAGLARLEGIDASPLAVELLQGRGFEAGPPLTGDAFPAFRPDVLTMLDVLEHFAPDTAGAELRSLLDRYQPKLLVVKVPISEGLFYRTATALGRLGFLAPLEQLYQVGTDPPHFSYFTRSSIERLLVAAGLTIVHAEPDRDFDAKALPDRVAVLRRFGALGAAAGRGIGLVAERVVSAIALEDSLTLFARRAGAAME